MGSHIFKVKFGPSFFLKCMATWFLLLIPELNRTVNGGTLEDLGILDKLLKSHYDRRATPTNHLNNTTPTRVWCELFVRSFGSPNPLTMDYKVDLYLRQQWVDERLKHKDIKRPMDLNDPNLVKAIWKPEVYFPNAKDADFQFVTVPNVLVRIHPDGKILYMLRLKITFSCMMDLSKFPLDRQTCTMEVASFSKTVEELILDWKVENPITTGTLTMTQFEMVSIVASKCHEAFQIGNYSCLVAEFHLARLLGFHLVQSYLPTILMVVISWVSFWMDVNSVPGRVTLGITTLLTVSSKATNVQENIESSYVKAIDVWMGACTAFVFLALMEFTVVNYLWRKEYQMHGRGGGGSRSVMLAHTMNTPDQNSGRGDGPGGGNGSGGSGDSVKGQGQTIPGQGQGDPGSPTPSGNIKTPPQPGTGPIGENAIIVGGGGNSWEARFVDNPANHLQYHTTTGKGGESTKCKFYNYDKTKRPSAANSVDGLNGNKRKSYQELAKSIDEACRVLFPIAFTIFVISYWVLYLFL